MDLIEAYYAVAQHLQEQAQRKSEIADMLGKMADAMSEQRMRESAPAADSAGVPAMAMLPNEHHPGQGCSCRDCLKRFSET